MTEAPSEPLSASPSTLHASNATETANVVEFGLRDLATFRLLHPSPADVTAFRKRLGPPAALGPGAPDMCFRFTERLSLPQDACMVGEDAAFTSDQFFLRSPRSMDRALACLPMDRIGLGGEVILESGSKPPLFEEILNLCVLQRGGLPLHASAFEFEGQGCLVGGWPHGGKTAVLIGMIAAGAKFLSDDWTFLHPDGVQLSGLPGRIEVRERYLRDIPELRARVPHAGGVRTAALRAGAGAARLAERLSPPTRRLAARVAHALEERQKLSLDPTALFGAERCVLRTRLDHFILCVASEQPGVEIRPMSLSETVTRTLASLAYERRKLCAHYLQFRFAFPERTNPLPEQAARLEQERLRRALDGRGLFLLRHPPLVSQQALAETLVSLLGKRPIPIPGGIAG